MQDGPGPGGLRVMKNACLEDQIPTPKRVHLAKMIAPDGRCSALCAPKPRAINLKRATWTHWPKFVTCPECLSELEAQRGTA